MVPDAGSAVVGHQLEVLQAASLDHDSFFLSGCHFEN